MPLGDCCAGMRRVGVSFSLSGWSAGEIVIDNLGYDDDERKKIQWCEGAASENASIKAEIKKYIEMRIVLI